jgi:hypothetical protein
VTYHLAGNFWALQRTETGICLSLGILCVWWTRRRLT